MTGDSACFVDPLFSSGVHLALMSGVMAAAYATTALKASDSGDSLLLDSSGKVYQELYYKEYNQFREMARLFYSSNYPTILLGRRIVEQDGQQSESPLARASFRGVAGTPCGYERVVLDRGEAPANFVSSVRAVESERVRRTEWLKALRSDPQRDWLLPSIPRLSTGTEAARRPVLAEGEFVWGMTLSTPSQPEGAPCSPLVAAIVQLSDGQTPVSAIVNRLSQGLDETLLADLRTAVTRPSRSFSRGAARNCDWVSPPPKLTSSSGGPSGLEVAPRLTGSQLRLNLRQTATEASHDYKADPF